MTFEFDLGLPALPSLAEAPGSAPEIQTANHRMPGLLGSAEVRLLQADGWGFADGGTKLANCYAVWSAKGKEMQLRFLACPEEYPELWAESPNESNGQT